MGRTRLVLLVATLALVFAPRLGDHDTARQPRELAASVLAPTTDAADGIVPSKPDAGTVSVLAVLVAAVALVAAAAWATVGSPALAPVATSRPRRHRRRGPPLAR